MNGLSKSKKISSRLDPHNYEVVKAIADLFFREPDETTGNFSEALNYLLTFVRLHSDMAPHIRHWVYKHRYLCGDRSEETMEGMKRYEAQLLKLSNE